MAAKGDELAPFLVEDAECADKEEKQAGFGAYGYVFKVKVNGVERIAKKIHSAYVNEVNPEEKQGITSKFRAECIILSKLRHPNIVQFVGVHYGREGMTDLTLFMECLSSDLKKFLSAHPNLPLSLKLSLLRDISFGLVYLHECEPPIVHRDLTVKNILISDKCQAKIADVGVAKAVDIQAQQAAEHTTNPGQQYYMPPEALEEKALCTPKLDIFSFGHLTLYTVNQEFPGVYEIKESSMMKAIKEGTLQRKKRNKSIDAVGEGHCLYPIITECLFDHPDQRPTSRDLNSRLCFLAAQHPHQESIVSEECDQLKNRVAALTTELDEAIRLKDEGFAEFQRHILQQHGEIQALQAELQRVRTEAASDIAAAKLEAEVFQADFYEERIDREKARKDLAELEKVHAESEAKRRATKLVVEKLAKQIEEVSSERDDIRRERDGLERAKTDLKYEVERRKASKHYKIKEYDRVKQEFHDGLKCNVKLVEQIEVLRKEKKEMLKIIKMERRRADKARSKTPTPVPCSEEESAGNQQSIAEELEALQSQISGWKDDIQHYQHVIRTLSIGIRDGSRLFPASVSSDGESLVSPTTDQQMNANHEAQSNGDTNQSASDPFQGDPNCMPSEDESDPIQDDHADFLELPPQEPHKATEGNTGSQAPLQQELDRGRERAAGARKCDTEQTPFQASLALFQQSFPTNSRALQANSLSRASQAEIKSRSYTSNGSISSTHPLTKKPPAEDGTKVNTVKHRGEEEEQENALVEKFDNDIRDVAAGVREGVDEENDRTRTMVHKPYDPNLLCPMCGKRHRIGEIQKFREQVSTCDGT